MWETNFYITNSVSSREVTVQKMSLYNICVFLLDTAKSKNTLLVEKDVYYILMKINSETIECFIPTAWP